MKQSLAVQSYRHRLGALGEQPISVLLLALASGVMIATLPFPYALAIVGGVASFLLILVQPLFGLALVLLAGPAGALENVFIGSRVPESGQLLLLVTLTVWIAHGVVRRQLVIHKTPLNIPFALFVGAALVSLLWAKSLSYGLKEVLKWIEIWLVMQMMLDLSITRPRTTNGRSLIQRNGQLRFDLRWLLGMLLIAGLSQAFIGIWQFALRGEGPDHFMILERFYRAFGTFQQPNPYGGYMGLSASLAIGVTVGMIFTQFKRVERRRLGPWIDWFWLMFFAVCAVFSTMGLVMSWSRGAWLGFAAGMAVFLLFLPRRRFIGLLLLVLTVLVLIIGLRLDLVPSALSGRLVSFSEDLQIGDVRGVHITVDNYAVIERLAHWQAGAEMARGNLAGGVGFGNYEPAYEEYATLNWPHPLGHAHNYYLNVLAEMGIGGALLYLVLWGAVFVQVIRLIGRLTWYQRGVALGLLAAWTALSVHHLFDKLYVNNLFIFFGALLGLQQVLATNNDHSNC